MNKGKLRSLMFHAGFCNEDGGWDNRPIWEQEHDNFQRFAELIVQECINEVEGLQVLQSTLDWSQHWNRAIAHTALHLKEHFGVED